MDYISRNDVLKAIDYQHEVNNVFESEAAYVQMWETINDDMGIKSADVQPVKHGQWVECCNELDKKCSCCDKVHGTIYEREPFCPKVYVVYGVLEERDTGMIVDHYIMTYDVFFQ